MRSPESLGCQWFEQVWNQNDVGALARLAAPGMRAHGADGVDRSPEDFAAFQRLMRRALPDLRIEVERCIDAGPYAAMAWTARGTHTGDTPELGPATARSIAVSGLSLVRIEGGRIVEGWDDYDHAGLLAQIQGARPR